jgi:GxxExxY protein
MHPDYQRAMSLTHPVIGGAIEVHKIMGPGLIESIYERCLMEELSQRSLGAVNQRTVRIRYKGIEFDEPLRFDVLVEGCLLVELKAVEKVLPIHRAQLMSYMKLLNVPVGLLFNFHEVVLKNGIERFFLPGANAP